MIKLKSEKIEINTADEPTEENEPGNLKIDGLNEAELLDRAKKITGKVLLENTLSLIENILEKRTNKTMAIRLSAELRKDNNRLTAIKQELTQNSLENRVDQREKIAERIAGELIAQPYNPEANAKERGYNI